MLLLPEGQMGAIGEHWIKRYFRLVKILVSMVRFAICVGYVIHTVKISGLVRIGKETSYSEKTSWCLFHGQRNVVDTVTFQG